MKNLSRRDFLRLSGAAVLAVGMTGALSGCDSSYVNTVTVQTVELNEEVETAYGKVKFTSYTIQNKGKNKWHITCGIEVMAAEGYTLEDGTALNLSDKDQKWLGLKDTFKF